MPFGHAQQDLCPLCSRGWQVAQSSKEMCRQRVALSEGRGDKQPRSGAWTDGGERSAHLQDPRAREYWAGWGAWPGLVHGRHPLNDPSIPSPPRGTFH